MLEWSRGSAEGEARGRTKALASPRGCNGSYIPLARDTVTMYKLEAAARLFT